MTSEQIKNKVLEYGDWEFFLERPFKAFYLSLFIGGNARKAINELGFNVEHEAWLFENGCWWQSDKVYEKAANDISKEIPKGLSVKKVSESCEKFRADKRKEILGLLKSVAPVLDKFKTVVHILKLNTSYIWLAHDFEHYYAPILKKEIPKSLSGDVDELIGNLSYPEKKNSHNYMEEDLRSGVSAEELVKRYGWIRVRDGFSEPFSESDFEEMRSKLLKDPTDSGKTIDVPAELKTLISELRELVYFRTLRTDVFYELMFLARPIVEAVGKIYGLQFKALRNYSVYDLLSGKLREYPELVTCAAYKDEHAFFTEPILPERDTSGEIKGKAAYKGSASGKVRIVKDVSDLPKVLEGDVLVTHMTTPNYLIAMQKAVAFVTDEGGITCHAAIVAREMKKPCIIGTKIATRVLKDGDFVEVDAEKGIVRIIKKKNGRG